MTGEQATGRVLGRAMRLAPALGKGLRLTLLMAMAGQAITVVTPVVIQMIIDDEILSPGRIDMGDVLWKAGLALVSLAVGVVVGRAAVLRLIRSSATGLSDLRTMTFRHLLKRSVLHVEADRRGDLVSRVTSDVTTLQEFMEWGGVGMVIAGSQVLLALGVMIFYEWRLALVAVIGVILYLVLMRWFQQVLAKNYDTVRVEVGRSLGVLSESISALPVVRAYGIEGATTEKVADALEKRFWIEYRTARLGNILFSSAEVFAGALTAAIVVGGILIGTAQGMTAGTLIAFLFLTNLLIEPLQIVVETLEFAQSAASGLRRILGVLDSEVDMPDPEEPDHLRPGGLSARLHQVGFSYRNGNEVLRDVTVDIPVGARMAVVGETGSGKTTFAKLLVRLLDPSRGTVSIGGVDARRIPVEELRSRVAFVPQEGFLFDDTVGANVRYGRPDASDAEVWTAFHELGLGSWVEDLPRGLDTQVGERGGNLSSGERQLVALVRAWIGSPDLLVLDEATSAVDPALDVALRQAIERLTEGRTSVTIAHRMATAEGSDEVLVFDQGELVERGRHRDLLGRGGVYAALYADWAAGTKTV
ncbi:MAG TPA: ABC transporter ATP-binding protein [Acidimicrobiia bacterium]|nr:ABC transporter ATP-binding protein [Acidimicrobiia bacterium]